MSMTSIAAIEEGRPSSIDEGMLLTSVLHRRAVATPSKVVYSFTSSSSSSNVDITFASLDASARRIAATLTRAPKGIDRPAFNRGDCVLLWYPPEGNTSHDLVAAFWGCLYAGAVAVVVDELKSLHRLLRDTHAVLGLTTSAFVRQRKLDKVKDALHLPKLFQKERRLSQTSSATNDAAAAAASRVTWLTHDRTVITPSKPTDLHHLDAQAGAGKAPMTTPYSATVACVVYTAGTSGSGLGGKPVQLTQANLAAAAASSCGWLESTDTLVGILPLHVASALVQSVVVPVLYGCRSVLVTDWLADPLRWMAVVSTEQAVYTFAPPRAFSLATRCQDRATPATRLSAQPLNLSSLVTVACTGGPLLPSTLAAFVRAWHLRPAQVSCGYSLVEATHAVTSTQNQTRGNQTQNVPPRVLTVSRQVFEQCHQLEPLLHVDYHSRPSAEDDGDSNDVMHLTSSGRPLLNTYVVVVDPISCVQMPDGLVGEVWVAGRTVSQGYLNHPSSSSSSHDYKWMPGTLQLSSTGHHHRHSRSSSSSSSSSSSVRRSSSSWGRPSMTCARRQSTVFSTSDKAAIDVTYIRTGDLGAWFQGELYVIGRSADVLQLPDRWLTPHLVETSVLECSVLVARVCVYGDDGVAIAAVETSADVQRLRDGAAVAHSLCNSVIQCVIKHHELHVAKVILLRPNAMPLSACGKVQRGQLKALVASKDSAAVVLEFMHYPRGQDKQPRRCDGFLI
ncbi:hypothetical protein DYB30_011124 [Aphanomyces astaci]|uniref:AMP-dependent synthetase/ligase domain-containing protein n=1 Tax=Aphanomyces astaci TaxID=112090 RepID=A0A397CT14_APHAT|nr:hypothetical protein DYB30_011124 [Aphanomyces astaci]